VPILYILILMLTPLAAWPASFNCAKAASVVEKMICADPGLGRLDEDLASAFKGAKEGTQASDSLDSGQKRRLKTTRNACRDKECLRQTYTERIKDLKTWNDPVPFDSSAFAMRWSGGTESPFCAAWEYSNLDGSGGINGKSSKSERTDAISASRREKTGSSFQTPKGRAIIRLS
jgi:uncharacterized protein